jgi:hypothetical protein
MTWLEIWSTRRKLDRLVGEDRIEDSATRFALLEDEIGKLIPPESQLWQRFLAIKNDSLKTSVPPPTAYSAVTAYPQVPPPDQLSDLIKAIKVYIAVAPAANGDLQEEVDRAIQKGYFKSIYFRAVLGGLALVLLLITGVEGYKLSEQLKAMQKMVEDARQEVEQGRAEVAKASSEVKNREAELSLMVLEGNEKIVEIRTKAISQIDEDGVVARSKMNERAKYWTEELDKAGSLSKQKIDDAGENGSSEIKSKTVQAGKDYDNLVSQNRKLLADKLTNTLVQLEAQRNPWVPRVLWSFSKAWLLWPIAVIIGLLSLLTSLTTIASTGQHYIQNARWMKIVAIANSVVLIGIAIGFTVLFIRG